MADGPALPFIRESMEFPKEHNATVQNFTRENVQSLAYSSGANVPLSKAFALDSQRLCEAGQWLRLFFD